MPISYSIPISKMNKLTLSEDDVLAIEPGCDHGGDEELGEEGSRTS